MIFNVLPIHAICTMSHRIDPILQCLVNLVEKRDLDGKPIIHIPMVIHVGPMFIYGDLVPSRVFHEKSKRAIKLVFDSFEQAETDVQFAFDLTTSQASEGSSDFIHLAKVCFSGPVGEQEPDPDTTGEMWRGRLSSIDGWTSMGSG